MAEEFAISDVFEITGRGAVAVIDEVTDRSVGKAHRVELIKPTGEIVGTEAFKEWLLRRDHVPLENEAYLLKGIHKADIPPGSRLRFVE
jgi:translation elongation factor EF-Tu-like GTPase